MTYAFQNQHPSTIRAWKRILSACFRVVMCFSYALSWTMNEFHSVGFIMNQRIGGILQKSVSNPCSTIILLPCVSSPMYQKNGSQTVHLFVPETFRTVQYDEVKLFSIFLLVREFRQKIFYLIECFSRNICVVESIKYNANLFLRDKLHKKRN